MPLVLPPGFANTRFRFRVAGLTDTIGFSIAVNPDGFQTASDIAASMNIAILSADLVTGPGSSTEWTYLGTSATLMTDTGPVIGEFNTAVQGTGDFPTVPSNCAVLVRKLTNSGGRKNRGRFYLPPTMIAEAAISGAGFITLDELGATQDQITALFEKLVVDGTPPYLLHTDPADAPTQIQAFVLQAQIATQRLRMR